MRHCGRYQTSKDDRVAVRIKDEVAHYSGLQSCGSVWACPVCQAKILADRAVTAATAAAGWMQSNTCLLAAFTMPHDAGDRLALTFDTVAEGFRYIARHRAWKDAKKSASVAGNIRSFELTHWLNGFHPHLHVLYFLRGQDDAAEQIAALGVTLRQLWGDHVEACGYRRPDELRGVHFDVCRSGVDAGQYIAKTDDGKSVGNELVRGDLKRGWDKHRTMLEVLEDFRWTGDVEDLAVWHEHERATHRRRRITWSRGLRSILAAEGIELAPDRSDDEIAAAEVGGRVAMLVEPESWRKVTRTPGLTGQLLDVIERSGVLGAAALLAEHECQWSLPPEQDRS